MRIKRTLILSSIVLALIVCVTIVSVSAAWFGDTLSITREVAIKTALPEGKIVINTNGAINRLDSVLTPAILNPGWALKAAQIDDSPYADTSKINVLDTNLVGTDKPLKSIARTVYVYFPIFGVGKTSGDGKLPAIVELTGAYIYKDSAQGINTETSVNYLDDLIVLMEVVTNVQEKEKTDGNITYYEQTCDSVKRANPSNLREGDGQIHWGYDSDMHKLGLLIDPATECYIKLSISFAKVDEDLPPELMNTLIRLNLIIPQSPTRTEVLAITNSIYDEED